MTRTEIELKIKENKEQIVSLKEQNLELQRQKCLICDDDGFFTEEIESHPKRKWQREAHPWDGKLIGRIHWWDNFKDEDTGEVVTIERSEVVRINGEWTF